MHDTTRLRRWVHILLLLFLDVVLATVLVLIVFFIVYEMPSTSPNNLTNTKSITSGLSPSSSHSGEITHSSDWRSKFATHFTSKIVSTANSYSSPNLSIKISKHTIGNGSNTLTYYIADIYMADIKSFQTHFANNTYDGGNQSLAEMSSEVGAILAMNGDSYSLNLSHLNGLLVRNGTVYRTNFTNADICVLYKDGTMVTSSPSSFNPQQAIKKGVLQTWVFGPKLLDENGRALKEFNTWDYIRKNHPRSAIGYFEPGHYSFVVADGRQDNYSRGMLLPELAAVFEDLGCVAAYNLDGGNTTFMTLHSAVVNHPSKPSKKIMDSVYIAEPTN
ncbi:phosphodiester glycosidase family protein [Paenibacillus sp. HW567]|uniref:phosphodiester glycosidase family protein n=1 Tax=Paenibacillus sp. HW567 TaxID=1034769 RepID=UPI00036BB875|nr:phosphodiester glycosidase family protein [Paenibacillus sp. HW567]